MEYPTMRKNKRKNGKGKGNNEIRSTTV